MNDSSHGCHLQSFSATSWSSPVFESGSNNDSCCSLFSLRTSDITLPSCCDGVLFVKLDISGRGPSRWSLKNASYTLSFVSTYSKRVCRPKQASSEAASIDSVFSNFFFSLSIVTFFSSSCESMSSRDLCSQIWTWPATVVLGPLHLHPELLLGHHLSSSPSILRITRPGWDILAGFSLVFVAGQRSERVSHSSSSSSQKRCSEGVCTGFWSTRVHIGQISSCEILSGCTKHSI